MKVAEKILSILDGMVDAGMIRDVIYNTPSMSNVSMSSAKMPCAVLYCITDWGLDISTRVSKETAMIKIFFLTRQPAISSDGRKNDAFITEMAGHARSFLTEVFDDGSVEIVEDKIQMKSIFNMGDTNATGISLEFTAMEVQGSCL